MPVTVYFFNDSIIDSIAYVNQTILAMKYWDIAGKYLALFL
jgi:hypothetical protein